MKFINMINNFYRNLLSIKYRVLISFFIMYISLIFLAKSYVNTIPSNIEVSIFDMLCDVYKGFGILGLSRYVFPMIPVFAFILVSIIDFDNEMICLIRNNSRKDIWNKQVVFTITLSFLYSVLIIFGGYLISGILIGSFDNKWVKNTGTIYQLLGSPNNWSSICNRFVSYKILFFTFTSNFLGLCAVGLLICTAKTFLKNQYVYLLLIINLFMTILFNNFSVFLSQMTINLVNWINPITIIKNDIYLILLILLLYMIGSWSVDKKDIIRKI